MDFVGIQQNCDVPLDVSGGESKILRYIMVDKTAKSASRQIHLMKFPRNFVRLSSAD